MLLVRGWVNSIPALQGHFYTGVDTFARTGLIVVQVVGTGCPGPRLAGGAGPMGAPPANGLA